jgi:hypothetical protein
LLRPNKWLKLSVAFGAGSLATALGRLKRGNADVKKTLISVSSLIALLLISTAGASSSPKVTGLFSNMRFYPDSGDVGGMEVFIVYASEGMSGQHYASVQQAEGSPEPPVIVKVTVISDKIEFKLPGAAGEASTFRGRVTAKSLVGSFEGSDEVLSLRRGKSCWQ